MQQNQSNTLQYLTIILVIAVFVLVIMTSSPAVDRTDYNEVRQIVQDEMNGIEVIDEEGFIDAFKFIMNETVPVTNDKVDKIYDEVLKDDLKETKAEELVKDEVDSRNFKKAIFEALETENVSIEDYKDITKFVISDIDTEVTGDDATVNTTLKVYYFIDGDEEEDQKAKISVDFEVTALDEDENYTNAEVDSNYTIEVLKIYE